MALGALHTLIANQEHTRIDTFVSGKLDGISRSYAVRLMTEGMVRCNGEKCKPSYKVMPGDVIEVMIPPPEESKSGPVPIPLDIRYDDEWLCVINKPQGMVVHPAPGHKDDTLVNALLYHYQGQLSDINGITRPGIVHRIDKDTSGLLLVVKNNQIHDKIAKAIREHQVKRTYLALLNGILKPDSGTIDLPIGRNPKNRLKNAVIRTGKPAITHFVVKDRFLNANVTYAQLSLETGRTHQIRVHFAHLGHPILGDPLYGGSRRDIAPGQLLHACKLEFYHPIKKNVIIIESALPEYFKGVLDRMK